MFWCWFLNSHQGKVLKSTEKDTVAWRWVGAEGSQHCPCLKKPRFLWTLWIMEVLDLWPSPMALCCMWRTHGWQKSWYLLWWKILKKLFASPPPPPPPPAAAAAASSSSSSSSSSQGSQAKFRTTTILPHYTVGIIQNPENPQTLYSLWIFFSQKGFQVPKWSWWCWFSHLYMVADPHLRRSPGLVKDFVSRWGMGISAERWGKVGKLLFFDQGVQKQLNQRWAVRQCFLFPNSWD